jgi:penicillin-binding protein 2
MLLRPRIAARDIPPELLRRVMVAGAVVFITVSLIVVRLVYLQLILGEEMRGLSEHNRIRLVRLPAARGVIYDRNHELLVDNRASFDVVFVPEDARAHQRGEVAHALAEHLREPDGDVDHRLRSPSGRPPYQGIVVRKAAEWDDVVAVETHQLDLPGVSIQVRPQRFYPYGELASHVLGYVGEASEADLEADVELRRGDVVGKSGVELAFDRELRGTPGGQRVEVDALGRRVQVLREVPDIPGPTVTLTLDRRLQQVAEEGLGEQAGAVVAIDPRTGGVLVLASRPNYDPNLFAQGISRAAWLGLNQDPLHPLRNRALHGQYPPGSTFKVAVAAAALAEGVVNDNTRYHCGGGLRFGNHTFHCWRRGGHGGVDVHRAIVQSCDVFFYQTGQRLGVDRIADYSRRFGLGVQTGIRLGSEKTGIIPDTKWKRERFDEPWYPGETLSVAIGQGAVTATPLQMAVLAATIASGGHRYRPQLVQRIEAADGTLIHELRPAIVAEVGVDPAVLEQVRLGMRDVVRPGGTGNRAHVDGIEVAGKTGTAQVVSLARSNRADRESKDHAWFIAFAPLENPEIAIAVLVEHAGGGGGKFAAPIAQRVLDTHFHGPLAPDVGPPVPQQMAHAF